jgi:hypothetical protein
LLVLERLKGKNKQIHSGKDFNEFEVGQMEKRDSAYTPLA